MITQKQSPAGSAGQNEKPEGDTSLINSSKDSEFADNTQIEISIPEGTAIDTTVKFPLDGANALLKQISEDIAEAFQCPIDFTLIPLVNALSTIGGNTFKIANKNYLNPPMFWTGIIAPSGSNKTAPLSFIMKPLLEIDSRSHEEYKQALAKWQKGGQEGEKPIYKQLILNNATPEARNGVLDKNRNGVCLYLNELAMKIQMVGKYSNGNSSELTEELGIWDNSFLRINRVGDGEDVKFIPCPFQTIIGTIQPGVLAKNFGKDSILDSGYLYRWDWLYPDNIEYPDYNNKSVSKDVTDFWNSSVSKLYDYVCRREETKEINLSTEAETLFISYYNELQKKKREYGDEYETSMYGKSVTKCLRLSLGFWLTDFVFKGCDTLEPYITKQMMQYSIDCMRYFEYTSLKVKSLIESKNMYRATKPSNKNIILDIKKLHPQFNQSVLADILNVDRSYISNVVSGRK